MDIILLYIGYHSLNPKTKKAPVFVTMVFGKMAKSFGCRETPLGFRVYIGLYRGYMGIMEKKMETTIMGSIGFRV